MPKNKKLKIFYHAIRLLNQAERILNGKSCNPHLDSQEKEELLAIREGKKTLEELFQKVKEKQKKVSSLKNATSLPKKSEANELNKWILDIRKQTYQQN